MVPEYHPYCQIYRTSPQFYKWGTDFGNGEYDKMIFQKDDNHERYYKEQCLINHKPLNYNKDFLYELNIIWDFISETVNHKRTSGFWLQDDYVVQRVEDDKDFMICSSVCLPSFWSPEDSLGKSLLQLHEPVPKLSLPPKTLEACTKNRFVRFVWSFVFQDKFNFHPNQPNQLKWNPRKPDWFIRVERQSIIGFPEIDCFLFVIKPYIVKNPKIKELVNTIEGMSEEFKTYKRITPEFETFLQKSL